MSSRKAEIKIASRKKKPADKIVFNSKKKISNKSHAQNPNLIEF